MTQEPTQQKPLEADDTARATTPKIAPGRCWAAAAWAVFVAVLLLVPGSSVPGVPWWVPTTFTGWVDSFVHAFLFLVQTVLLERAFSHRAYRQGRRIRVTGLFVGALLLELLQVPIPGRSFQFLDLVLAALGIAAALALIGRGRPIGAE